MARQKSELTRQCEAAGVPVATIQYRMRKGLSLKEALALPNRKTMRRETVYDRNRPQIAQAEMSWQAVRNCVKSLETQVRMLEQIIEKVKEDPAGRKVHERVMKEIVEEPLILGGGR